MTPIGKVSAHLRWIIPISQRRRSKVRGKNCRPRSSRRNLRASRLTTAQIRSALTQLNALAEQFQTKSRSSMGSILLVHWTSPSSLD